MFLVIVLNHDSAVRDGLTFALKAHGCEVRSFVRASEILESPLLERASCLVVSEQILNREGFDVVRAYEAQNPRGVVILLTRHLTARVLPPGTKVLPTTDHERPLLVEDLVDEIIAVSQRQAWPHEAEAPART